MMKIVILAFLAAVNCAHITTIQEVDSLVDKTIVDVEKEIPLDIPEFPGVKILGVDKLKRQGNCVKTAEAGVFKCTAVSTESQVKLEDEVADITLKVTFEVVVDAEGHLIKYEVKEVNVDLKDGEPTEDPETFGLGKKLKKAWKKIKHAAEEAVGAVIKKKVTDIVTSIATSILGR